MMAFGRITGWAIDLPDRILTNDELSQMVDTSDEWIRERSGISTRHIDGKVSDCLLYTSPSPRDYAASRMPSSA